MAVLLQERPAGNHGELNKLVADLSLDREAHSVLIDKHVYKGNTDTPKGRKVERTARNGALSPGPVQDVALLREMLLVKKSDSLLFPAERKTSLSRDNVWSRHMAPKLDTVGVKWATVPGSAPGQCAARASQTSTTRSPPTRGDHGLSVSLEGYFQSDLEQKIEAVKRLESEVI